MMRRLLILSGAVLALGEDAAAQVPDSARPLPRDSSAALATRLDTIRASARSTGEYDEFLDRHDVYARMARAAGSTFITRSEIERRNTGRVTALLRDVPGVRVVSRPGRAGRNDVPVGRTGCPLSLIVDGRPVELASAGPSTSQAISTMRGNTIQPPREMRNPTSDAFDDIVNPDHVAAIEVYPSQNLVPAVFASVLPMGANCGVIAVWTYYGRKADAAARGARSP